MNATPAPAGIFSTDQWVIAQGTADERRVVVRMRAQLPSEPDRAVFCRLTIIKWEYQPQETGMPDPATQKRMQSFENALQAGTEQRGAGFQAVSITGGGEKEWRYYTSDTDAFMKSLSADLVGHRAYPLTIEFFDDPEWSGLSEYLLPLRDIRS